MGKLFSRYESGLQFTAGPIAGSATGTSGLNPIVDRINSVAPYDNTISGVDNVYANNNIEAGDFIFADAGQITNDVTVGNSITAGGAILSNTDVTAIGDVKADVNISGANIYSTNNVIAGNDISGTNVYASNNIKAGSNIEASRNVTAGGYISGANVFNDVSYIYEQEYENSFVTSTTDNIGSFNVSVNHETAVHVQSHMSIAPSEKGVFSPVSLSASGTALGTDNNIDTTYIIHGSPVLTWDDARPRFDCTIQAIITIPSGITYFKTYASNIETGSFTANIRRFILKPLNIGAEVSLV